MRIERKLTDGYGQASVNRKLGPFSLGPSLGPLKGVWAKDFVLRCRLMHIDDTSPVSAAARDGPPEAERSACSMRSVSLGL
ncbi:hypothetical protein QQF64_014047 [Cirrhinus molitorella]|uniref:Uncharacterized protein n=1 Tax=Cirrhinus molitorella TaxID=172907 RepID=A0ABR3LVE0_9TELE